MPSGDQVAFEMRAPGGMAMAFLVPSAAEMTWMPMLVRLVSDRARLALKSTKTPPSSWNGFENVFISTGPSPISSRNHFLSALIMDSVSSGVLASYNGSASSLGGVA